MNHWISESFLLFVLSSKLLYCLKYQWNEAMVKFVFVYIFCEIEMKKCIVWIWHSIKFCRYCVYILFTHSFYCISHRFFCTMRFAHLNSIFIYFKLIKYVEATDGNKPSVAHNNKWTSLLKKKIVNHFIQFRIFFLGFILIMSLSMIHSFVRECTWKKKNYIPNLAWKIIFAFS